MVDTQDKNLDSTQTQPNQATASEKTQPNSQSPDVVCHPVSHMSKGEKIFNWSVYSGLNYWVNLISSIAIADVLTHGKGRKAMDFAIGKTAKGLQKTTGATIEKSYHHAKVGLETLALTSGGWILLVPLKILEDNKRKVVHWLNKKFGEVEVDAKGNELPPEKIHLEEDQPHQGWGRVIFRRILASGSVMASGSLLDHVAADKSKPTSRTFDVNPYVDKGEKVTLDGHLGGKEWTTGKIMEGINWAARKVSGGKEITEGSTPYRWLQLAALDTFFTKLTAVVMYATRGAEKGKKNTGNNNPVISEAQPELDANQPVAINETTPYTAKERKKERSDILDKTPISHVQKTLNESQQSSQLML